MRVHAVMWFIIGDMLRSGSSICRSSFYFECIYALTDKLTIMHGYVSLLIALSTALPDLVSGPPRKAGVSPNSSGDRPSGAGGPPRKAGGTSSNN